MLTRRIRNRFIAEFLAGRQERQSYRGPRFVVRLPRAEDIGGSALLQRMAQSIQRGGSPVYVACVLLALTGCAASPDGSGGQSIGIGAGGMNYHFGASPFDKPAPGCAGAIGAFQAVIDADVATGQLNKPVYDRATADLRPAWAACKAGRDDNARTSLAAVKARYGYR
jgi:hypothetical protein